MHVQYSASSIEESRFQGVAVSHFSFFENFTRIRNLAGYSIWEELQNVILKENKEKKITNLRAKLEPTRLESLQAGCIQPPPTPCSQKGQCSLKNFASSRIPNVALYKEISPKANTGAVLYERCSIYVYVGDVCVCTYESAS